MYKQVAKLTENTLDKNFSIELLEIWGQLNLDNNQKIKTAEKWLEKNLNDAGLLQILGQLCLQNKLWGKAQTYLHRSIEINPNAKTFKLMAQYFDAINEPENALAAYRQAENIGKQLLLIDGNSDGNE